MQMSSMNDLNHRTASDLALGLQDKRLDLRCRRSTVKMKNDIHLPLSPPISPAPPDSHSSSIPTSAKSVPPEQFASSIQTCRGLVFPRKCDLVCSSPDCHVESCVRDGLCEHISDLKSFDGRSRSIRMVSQVRDSRSCSKSYMLTCGKLRRTLSGTIMNSTNFLVPVTQNNSFTLGRCKLRPVSMQGTSVSEIVFPHVCSCSDVISVYNQEPIKSPIQSSLKDSQVKGLIVSSYDCGVNTETCSADIQDNRLLDIECFRPLNRSSPHGYMNPIDSLSNFKCSGLHVENTDETKPVGRSSCEKSCSLPLDEGEHGLESMISDSKIKVQEKEHGLCTGLRPATELLHVQSSQDSGISSSTMDEIAVSLPHPSSAVYFSSNACCKEVDHFHGDANDNLPVQHVKNDIETESITSPENIIGESFTDYMNRFKVNNRASKKFERVPLNISNIVCTSNPLELEKVQDRPRISPGRDNCVDASQYGASNSVIALHRSGLESSVSCDYLKQRPTFNQGVNLKASLTTSVDSGSFSSSELHSCVIPVESSDARPFVDVSRVVLQNSCCSSCTQAVGLTGYEKLNNSNCKHRSHDIADQFSDRQVNFSSSDILPENSKRILPDHEHLKMGKTSSPKSDCSHFVRRPQSLFIPAAISEFAEILAESLLSQAVLLSSTRAWHIPCSDQCRRAQCRQHLFQSLVKQHFQDFLDGPIQNQAYYNFSPTQNIIASKEVLIGKDYEHFPQCSHAFKNDVIREALRSNFECSDDYYNFTNTRSSLQNSDSVSRGVSDQPSSTSNSLYACSTSSCRHAPDSCSSRPSTAALMLTLSSGSSPGICWTPEHPLSPDASDKYSDDFVVDDFFALSSKLAPIGSALVKPVTENAVSSLGSRDVVKFENYEFQRNRSTSTAAAKASSPRRLEEVLENAPLCTSEESSRVKNFHGQNLPDCLQETVNVFCNPSVEISSVEGRNSFCESKRKDDDGSRTDKNFKEIITLNKSDVESRKKYKKRKARSRSRKRSASCKIQKQVFSKASTSDISSENLSKKCPRLNIEKSSRQRGLSKSRARGVKPRFETSEVYSSPVDSIEPPAIVQPVAVVATQPTRISSTITAGLPLLNSGSFVASSPSTELLVKSNTTSVTSKNTKASSKFSKNHANKLTACDDTTLPVNDIECVSLFLKHSDEDNSATEFLYNHKDKYNLFSSSVRNNDAKGTDRVSRKERHEQQRSSRICKILSPFTVLKSCKRKDHSIESLDAADDVYVASNATNVSRSKATSSERRRGRSLFTNLRIGILALFGGRSTVAASTDCCKSSSSERPRQLNCRPGLRGSTSEDNLMHCSCSSLSDSDGCMTIPPTVPPPAPVVVDADDSSEPVRGTEMDLFNHSNYSAFTTAIITTRCNTDNNSGAILDSGQQHLSKDHLVGIGEAAVEVETSADRNIGLTPRSVSAEVPRRYIIYSPAHGATRALPPIPVSEVKVSEAVPGAVLPVAGRNDLASMLDDVKDYGWYWGPISSTAAEKIISNEPDGSFIVRDSSDDRYIFSLTFKLNGSARHVRIDHDKGNFSFGGSTRFKCRTIVEFIESAVEHSRSGCYLFFIHRRPVLGPMRVQLLHPVSRFRHMQSLQHICRFVIVKHVRRDLLHKLPLPNVLLQYVSSPHYYSEQVEQCMAEEQELIEQEAAIRQEQLAAVRLVQEEGLREQEMAARFVQDEGLREQEAASRQVQEHEDAVLQEPELAILSHELETVPFCEKESGVVDTNLLSAHLPSCSSAENKQMFVDSLQEPPMGNVPASPSCCSAPVLEGIVLVERLALTLTEPEVGRLSTRDGNERAEQGCNSNSSKTFISDKSLVVPHSSGLPSTFLKNCSSSTCFEDESSRSLLSLSSYLKGEHRTGFTEQSQHHKVVSYQVCLHNDHPTVVKCTKLLDKGSVNGARIFCGTEDISDSADGQLGEACSELSKISSSESAVRCVKSSCYPSSENVCNLEGSSLEESSEDNASFDAPCEPTSSPHGKQLASDHCKTVEDGQVSAPSSPSSHATFFGPESLQSVILNARFEDLGTF